MIGDDYLQLFQVVEWLYPAVLAGIVHQSLVSTDQRI